ncbi:MAG: glycosyltransferase family 2 protein [Thermodesulfobacteriota bacterium]|nr:glycosyltransferase family 2 protein [Thermodesulfobacteriota bacterium]
MRVIALLATYNEERFIANCLEHLIGQGIDVYLIDNQSTDRTIPIAKSYLGKGLLDVDTFNRSGVFSLWDQLKRKEMLAASLDADWFMHVDADEIRLPPHSGTTLIQAFAEVDAQGYNAVNFLEYTFIPTREEPDHDHSDYLKTMRWYYPFLPGFPHRVNAWKRQPTKVDLVSSGGHRVYFPERRMYWKSFPMKHYLYLSKAQANEKYVQKEYDPKEVAAGFHKKRIRIKPEHIQFPSESELRTYYSDDELDFSKPRTVHYIFNHGADRGRDGRGHGRKGLTAALKKHYRIRHYYYHKLNEKVRTMGSGSGFLR